MYKLLFFVVCIVITGSFSNSVHSQVTILTSDLTNPPANSCTSTAYTVSGNLGNTNYGYSGPVVVVTGFSITVEMDYYTGFAPMPGLTPFSEDIDLGLLPEGAYNITTTGLVDGSVTSIDTGSFIVETCCTGFVDLGQDSLICDTSTLILDATTIGASYNWQDGSSASTFSVNSTGIYWVEVTDTNGCVYSDSVTVTVVDCSLSLDQFSPNAFRMYPNPANNTFQILGLTDDSKVSIVNLTGEAVPYSQTNTSIDVPGLTAGIYVVRVERNGQIHSNRLVIQK